MRIVAASDGTAPSSIAQQLLATTRWPSGSFVRIVATREAVEGASGRSPLSVPPQPSREADVARPTLALLEDLAPHLRGSGVDVELVASHDPLSSALLDSARRVGADLIVVGGRTTQARRDAARPLDLELLERARCPVLVARLPTVTRILLAIDRTGGATAIPRILGRWGVFTRTPIDVVSVAEPSASAFVTPWAFPVALDRDLERHRSIADTAAHELVRLGWDATSTVRFGLSAREIVAAADEHGADLIVIAAHGEARPGPSHLGVVAREVLDRTHGSVLVVGERRSRPRAGAVANGPRADGLHPRSDALTRS